jgi:hypothetical protein
MSAVNRAGVCRFGVGRFDARRATNPWLDCAVGIEVGDRVREALMSVADWDDVLDRLLDGQT